MKILFKYCVNLYLSIISFGILSVNRLLYIFSDRRKRPESYHFLATPLFSAFGETLNIFMWSLGFLVGFPLGWVLTCVLCASTPQIFAQVNTHPYGKNKQPYWVFEFFLKFYHHNLFCNSEHLECEIIYSARNTSELHRTTPTIRLIYFQLTHKLRIYHIITQIQSLLSNILLHILSMK